MQISLKFLHKKRAFFANRILCRGTGSDPELWRRRKYLFLWMMQTTIFNSSIRSDFYYFVPFICHKLCKNAVRQAFASSETKMLINFFISNNKIQIQIIRKFRSNKKFSIITIIKCKSCFWTRKKNSFDKWSISSINGFNGMKLNQLREFFKITRGSFTGACQRDSCTFSLWRFAVTSIAMKICIIAMKICKASLHFPLICTDSQKSIRIYTRVTAQKLNGIYNKVTNQESAKVDVYNNIQNNSCQISNSATKRCWQVGLPFIIIFEYSSI